MLCILLLFALLLFLFTYLIHAIYKTSQFLTNHNKNSNIGPPNLFMAMWNRTITLHIFVLHTGTLTLFIWFHCTQEYCGHCHIQSSFTCRYQQKRTKGCSMKTITLQFIWLHWEKKYHYIPVKIHHKNEQIIQHQNWNLCKSRTKKTLGMAY